MASRPALILAAGWAMVWFLWILLAVVLAFAYWALIRVMVSNTKDD